jgi:hypothetical protein
VAEIGRNDPCPCSSGRKYKACCMAADRAASRAHGGGLSAEELRQAQRVATEAARASEEWQADVVPVPATVQGEEHSPAALLVMAGGYIVISDVVSRRPEGAAQRAAVLADGIRSAARQAGVYPPRVLVRDGEDAEHLAAIVADRQVEVAAAPLPELDHALDGLLASLGNGPLSVIGTRPDTWAETGATPAELADFHGAAAEYFAARPWDELTDLMAVHFRFDEGGEWWGSVMGGAGIEFGLAIYSRQEDLLDIVEGDDGRHAHEIAAGMQGFALSFSFEERSRLTRLMQREVARAGWPVAAPDAYPFLWAMRAPERRITADHVRRLTRVLRAMALHIGGHDPQPATGVSVDVHDVRVEGSPEDGDSSLPWPLPERPHQILAEGPGAEPEAALPERRPAEGTYSVEEPRYERFVAWLGGQKLPKTARTAAERNAWCWCSFLTDKAIHAGAVTEFDLRGFLYLYLPFSDHTTRTASRDVVRSLRLLFRFLEAEEGIGYPFGSRVLDELAVIAAKAKGAGDELEEVMEWMGASVELDLDRRAMVSHTGIVGSRVEWPDDFTSPEVATIRVNLQRSWLLWYGEEVRRGATDFYELLDALVTRQQEWERTPNAAAGGRTPIQALKDLRASPKK